MLAVIEKFHKIIDSYKIYDYSQTKGLFKIRAQITLKNDTILEIKDFRFREGKRKYSFHWMDKNKTLIIRWDNAEHWKNIPTFPHHKHVKNVETVKESFEISLEQVLEIISETLE